MISIWDQIKPKISHIFDFKYFLISWISLILIKFISDKQKKSNESGFL